MLHITHIVHITHITRQAISLKLVQLKNSWTRMDMREIYRLKI